MAQITDARFPASPTAPPRMTYEEFLSHPDVAVRAEWVDGEVIELSPTSNVDQDLADFLTALLRHFAEGRVGGIVRSTAFNMKTGPSLPGRQPDVLYVAPEHGDRLRESHLAGPADLAVEIVSPDSEARDRVQKLQEYEAGGVREYWVIDPRRRQADFYHLGSDARYRPIAVDDQGVFRSVVLSGLWLKVDWLWQRPLPPLLTVLKTWGLV